MPRFSGRVLFCAEEDAHLRFPARAGALKQRQLVVFLGGVATGLFLFHAFAQEIV